MRRITVVVVILFVVLFLAIIILNTRPLQQQITQLAQKVSQQATPTVTTKKNLSTYQKLAAGILDWISVQRDSRGLYLVSRSCVAGSNCDQNVMLVNGSAHSGLPAIWARYLFDSTLTTNLSKELHQNVHDYYYFAKSLYLQNDLWSCKYFYQMSQDNRFSEAEKQQMQEMCFKYTGYVNINNVMLYIGGPEVNVVHYRLKKEAPSFSQVKGKLGQLPVDPNVAQHGSETSAYASDFVARYLWAKNPDDLKIAEAYFLETANYYEKSPTSFSQADYCALGNSADDLYRTTKNEDYLSFAKNLVTVRLAKEKVLYSPVCGLWLKDLYKETQEAQVPPMVQSIANRIVSNDLDIAESGRKIIGDGAYLTPAGDGGNGLLKSVKDNGLAAAFLLQL